MRPVLRIIPRFHPFRVLPARTYATLNPHTPPPTSPYQVFDEPSKDLQRSRAIIRLRELQAQSENKSAEEEDGLRVDLKVPPSSILELSSHAGQLTQVLQEVLADEVPTTTEQTGVEGRRKWWIVDSSREALWRDDDSYFITPPTRIQASASDFLKHPEVGPLKEQVEAVVSAGGLHWVGDIVDSTDAPSLLNRAGFTSITVDVEDITVNYPSMWELIADLRDMGESNAILGRRTAVGRDVLIAASSIYQEMYGNEDGSIPATFSIIFLIGWKPGPNQPQPSKRGSGETSLKDVL
ncbi:hypothetical protein I307_04425 [Cryptococcus deuterogattii 99/473]|uniref:Uncharacterized protein n=1 Tax=Cryptococcus deuterogattii Ram5 TaxID=1296110 RepID=A0A0D0TZF4_9TREE|nr:hypothetical protein I309_04763 [Cryptococcus deuterogattii LA55]KIR34270.1 hypothetical protein I352_03507 [Cryptococcus deuterogattii MMRL2647]KIR41343.1 hypothetical protein I313_02470 [Cryptococcus deuterogattii Ram5]KIR89915.1 hypothetical protein I304_06160 [Cryptococcus deuterogattii CBS 10090]KIR98642.1 hypothetical protein L804_04218 [Cryptococcus deuterogattii 2001/935-1]KIY56313.1 hypothetical protein I307_04425 [Cryptococcus deuterogattii 99/473]